AGPSTTRSPTVVPDPEAMKLRAISSEAVTLGLAQPEVDYEIVDAGSGEVQAWADLAWPLGLRTGLTEPVAYLEGRDEELERRLGELGWRFFTDEVSLRRYWEEVLGVDLDGDRVIGAPKDEEIGSPDVDDAIRSRPADQRPDHAARTWYVNFGDNLERSWDDARRHGFVSAGGGVWYSKPIRRIQTGDTLLVYLPGSGYAGIATATRQAVPFDEAVVDTQNGPARLADLELTRPYTHAGTDEDPGEYVVSVNWHVAVRKTEAHKQQALFSNQATAVEMRPDVPRHALTIESVRSTLLQ
ncbi:MAG: hypothetical protein LC808_25915, partial [Actinobacteria bacterium]|nr:hypothetical protein [Actinomycetota bacterium]